MRLEPKVYSYLRLKLYKDIFASNIGIEFFTQPQLQQSSLC